MESRTLSVPSFFDEDKVGEIWQVPYQQRMMDALEWASQNNIKPMGSDDVKVAIMGIDIQITFCIPSGELYVGGANGRAAIDDNIRFSKYIYENINNITKIIPTLDTHRNVAIFHSPFWINSDGENPEPNTIITEEMLKEGQYRVNPKIAGEFGGNYVGLQNYANDYIKELEKSGRYALIIWPFHAMLGGIGHALVPSVEEAFFFHNIARGGMPEFQVKGGNPLTENYSIFQPEVKNVVNKAQKNTAFLNNLLTYDIVIIAGQAKSHCVAWTIYDLLNEINAQDSELAKKVYLLEDCTSPVVVLDGNGNPIDGLDFTEVANKAFNDFRDAGMNIIDTNTPIYELI